MAKSHRKHGKREETKRHVSHSERATFHGGFPAGEVEKIKRGKWWCGDYTCDAAGGGSWTAGQTQRICDPGWSGCPTNVTLADGSKWTLSANCKQDG